MPNACLKDIRTGRVLYLRQVINRIITCLPVLATKIPVFIGSLGYTKQTGVSLNSEMERFTGRVDASNKYKKVELE